MTLVEFLRARLADDEQAAKAWLPFGNPDEAARAHVARHDPRRVLAEVEAKRKLKAEAFHHAAKIDSEWGCVHSAEQIEAGLCPEERPDELPILRILAQVYDWHPDYRDEWRPEY